MGAGDMDEDDEEGNSAEQRAGRADDAGARPPIYNAEGLHEKLEDISWPTEVSAAFACMAAIASVRSNKPCTMCQLHLKLHL